MRKRTFASGADEMKSTNTTGCCTVWLTITGVIDAEGRRKQPPLVEPVARVLDRPVDAEDRRVADEGVPRDLAQPQWEERRDGDEQPCGVHQQSGAPQPQCA